MVTKEQAPVDSVGKAPPMEVVEFYEPSKMPYWVGEMKEGKFPGTELNDYTTYISKDDPLKVDRFTEHNRAMLKNNVDIADVPGGEDMYLEDGSVSLSVLGNNPREWQRVEAKGKIGLVEGFQMLNKWELLPWLNLAAVEEDISVFVTMKKIQNKEHVTQAERKRAEDFMREMAEIQIRGFTLGGYLSYYGLRMPAYAIEFGATLGLTKVGSEFAKQTAKQTLKQSLIQGAKTMARGGAKMTANPLMWHRVAKTYGNFQLNDSLQITDKGMAVFKDAENSPAMTLLRAFGDTWVENSSELAGWTIFKPIVGAVGRKMPKGLVSGYKRLAEKHLAMRWGEALAQYGYDGILEELGEERLGDFLRVTFALDRQKGYSVDQFVEAIFPGWEEFLLEAGMISVYGASSLSLAKLSGKLGKGKEGGEIEQIFKEVSNLSEKQREDLFKQIESKEAADDIKLYEEKRAPVAEMLVRELGQEEADAALSIYDSFYATTAQKIGKSRAELLKEFPLVVRGGAPLVGKEVLEQRKREFYSKLGQTIAEKMPNSMLVKDFENWVNKQGIKAEEIQYSGLKEFLEGKEKVSKEEVAEFVLENQVEIQEVVKGGQELKGEWEELKGEEGFKRKIGNRWTFIHVMSDGTVIGTGPSKYKKKFRSVQEAKDHYDEDVVSTSKEDTKFHNWQIPGGENYREILLTIPSRGGKDKTIDQEMARIEKAFEAQGYEISMEPGGDAMVEKDGEMVEPEDVPADLIELAGQYDNYLRDNEREEVIGKQGDYKSSHWAEPNVLVHFRLNDHTDQDGKKVLFIEEIQSDWHQKGREKGYQTEKTKRTEWGKEGQTLTLQGEGVVVKVDIESHDGIANYYLYTPGGVLGRSFNTLEAAQKEGELWAGNLAKQEAVPDAPFKKTEAWSMLAFKKILNMAVEQGYDKVAWTTGEVQAERYDLSKQIEEVEALKNRDGTYDLIVVPKGDIAGNTRSINDVKEADLPSTVGKDLATKIVNDFNEGKYTSPGSRSNVYKGLDLKVGGEGMKGFYDDILVKSVDKYVKKWGAKTSDIKLKADVKEASKDVDRFPEAFAQATGVKPSPAIEVTDAMKKDITAQGQPLFQEGFEEKRDIEREPEGEKRSPLQQGKQGLYNPKMNIVQLFEGANKSTFLHETGHYFLQMYLKYLPNELSAVFKWAGVAEKPLDQLTDAEYKKLQESFARGFEAYVMEGKAPNETLANAFERFKNWLTEIYQQAVNILSTAGKVKLSKEITEFMDSMLSVDPARIATIDSTVTAERLAMDKDTALYQTTREKLDELKKKRKKLIKKHGKIAKAELEGVLQTIKDLEVLEGTVRAADMREAEAAWLEHPLSDVLAQKIRIDKSYEGILKDYQIPANWLTTTEYASTVDEIAAEHNMTDEQLLRELRRVRSKSQFIDEYLGLKKDAIEAQQPTVEKVEQELKEVAEKLKKDAEAGDVTVLQHEVIQAIRDSDMDARDKVKMLGMIQKAKTAKSQAKVLGELYGKEEVYLKNTQKRLLKKKIADLLKTTKPEKREGYVKGKYDYQTNILFARLREINKMSIKDARIEIEGLPAFNDQNLESMEDAVFKGIERAMLTFKSYEFKDAPLEVYEVVYENLLRIREAARGAADIEAFEKKLKKHDEVEKVLKSIEGMKFKGDAKDLATKLLNIYRTGSLFAGANLWSLINSVAGKSIADKYNLERHEKTQFTNTHFHIVDITEAAKEAFGFKNSMEFMDYLDTARAEEYKLVELKPEFEGYGVRQFSRMGIIDIYNAIKNDKTRSDYYNSYGQENVTELVNLLTDSEMAFADMLMEKAQELRDEINKRHIELTGLDLKMVENYWPATSKHQQMKANDNMTGEIIMASFQKQRVDAPVVPIPVDAMEKVTSHMAGAEQVVEVIPAWREARGMFDNNTVKEAIVSKYGLDVYQTLIRQMNTNSLTGLKEDSVAINSIFAKAFRNWVKAKVALNPAVFLKQLISVSNYMENMPSGEWVKYFVEGMADPKATLEFMFKNSPYLEARFSRGYSEDISKAVQAGEKIGKKQGLSNILTWLVRTGDIGAIVYGGYPMIRYLTEVEKMSMPEAVEAFEASTVRSQQSGLKSSLDLTQQSKNPLVNFFFAFKNTPKQYMRKIADAMISYYNGEIDAGQLAKTLSIYMVIQPGLFAMVGYMMFQLRGGDDEDGFVDDVAASIGTSFTNAFPVVNDVTSIAVQAIIAKATGGKKPRAKINIPVIGDLEKAMASALKDELTIGDFFNIISVPVEISTGLPVKTTIGPVLKRAGVTGGKKKKGIKL